MEISSCLGTPGLTCSHLKLENHEGQVLDQDMDHVPSLVHIHTCSPSHSQLVLPRPPGNLTLPMRLRLLSLFVWGKIRHLHKPDFNGHSLCAYP